MLSAAFLSVALVLGEFTIASLLNQSNLQVGINLLSKRNASMSIAVSFAALAFAFILLFLLSLVGGAPREWYPPRSPRDRRPPRTDPGRAARARGRRTAGRPAPHLRHRARARRARPGHRARASIVSLFGPSGCGKTTALRLLAGLEETDGSKVYVDGKDVTDVPANRRDMVMVFQAYSLFPHMTTKENVEFGLRLRRVDGAARSERASEMLELVGLSAQANRYPHQMSGGQQQRVALARALAIRPQVLLLDEPFSALDAKVRVPLRDEIRRIQLEVGTTTLFVTHDQEEALGIADRVGIMRAGNLEQIAPPDIRVRPPRPRRSWRTSSACPNGCRDTSRTPPSRCSVTGCRWWTPSTRVRPGHRAGPAGVGGSAPQRHRERTHGLGQLPRLDGPGCPSPCPTARWCWRRSRAAR